jgi:DNA polymerase-3 subunit alpha
MSEFVHLHNHTHYSLCDALATPEQLVKAAKNDGMDSIALTDHGVMFGVMEFAKYAKSNGIKPLIGFEAYVANGSRFDTSAGKAQTKRKNYYHLILLAKNTVGYKNLLKLTTFAHTEGFYYKPRIDRELLEKYNEGIIALSACMGGVVNAHLIDNDYEEGFNSAKYYQQLFGEDFYIELQNHFIPGDEIILRDAPKIARDLGIKLVATNDIHYIKKEQAVAHNILLYIKDSSQIREGMNIYELRYKKPEMYFKTTAQMKDLFKEFPESISNTLEIADKCDFQFKTGLFMPEFPIPKESQAKTLDDYLVEVTYEGLNYRFKNEIAEEIKDRADFELNVIRTMGFAGYFLIVQDFINAAKAMGVSVGPGRGSAAGSMVAFALGITNIDPIKYDLLFERFLNPERVSMPDIDIDFNDVNRYKVIEYVKEKYGKECVAQIVTFGKLTSKAVLKDVARVLGIPHTEINALNKFIPVDQGKVKPLAEAFKLPDIIKFMEGKSNKYKELMEYSQSLENLNRNTGIHAAGVVITPSDVTNYVPLYQSGGSKKGEICTQFSMKELEDAGILKMDFLGLRTLSIIDNSLEMIEQNYNEKIDIDAIGFDDDLSYEIFGNGNTLGIFQFESSGMQKYLKDLKPKNLDEITAMNALYRPGPMDNIPEFIDRKFGRKPIEYLSPLMENSLKSTYGIIVYQEQVMQLARDIAGYTLGGADTLRRIMGKKKKEDMAKQKPVFVDSSKIKGIDGKISEEIFELIAKFASYGFNKSHAVAYSYLAYQTAWLKAHYPAEFIAANMSAELNNQNKIVQFIEECKKYDIVVMPPNVNKSKATFVAENNVIYFGMAGIKDVGVNAAEAIIVARQEKPFESFFDFIKRVDSKAVNKRTLEALICSGAFDSLGNKNRAQLHHAVELAVDFSKKMHEKKDLGMEDMFGGSISQTINEPNLPEISNWTDEERLNKEKEFLNFYISGHPMDAYKPYITSLATLELGNKDSNLFGETVRVTGIISSIRTRLDKKNETIAFVILEDYSGRAECIFWSNSYRKYKDMIVENNVVMFIGKAEGGKSDNGETEAEIKVIVDQVQSLEEAANNYAKGFYIKVESDKTSPETIQEFYNMCKDIHVRNMIIFQFVDKIKKETNSFRAIDINISFSEKNIIRICDLFGKNNVKLLT